MIALGWNCLLPMLLRLCDRQFLDLSHLAGGLPHCPTATSRRALDAATDLVGVKRDRATNSPIIGNAHVQRQLMRAEGAWSAANAGVEQALIRMWEDARQSRRLPIATRIALLTVNVHASAMAIEIIASVCDVIGTSVAPAGAIFGACLRDARTLGSHTAVGGGKLELAAQMRFGLLEDTFLV
jgi:alkylation response protein AidB-like acyl-CoA dehydrogenase